MNRKLDLDMSCIICDRDHTLKDHMKQTERRLVRESASLAAERAAVLALLNDGSQDDAIRAANEAFREAHTVQRSEGDSCFNQYMSDAVRAAREAYEREFGSAPILREDTENV